MQDESSGRVARAALAPYDLPPGLDLRPVSPLNNAVFEAAGAGGQWALRVHRPGYRPPEHIRSELAS